MSGLGSSVKPRTAAGCPFCSQEQKSLALNPDCPGRSPNAWSFDLMALRPFTPMRRLNEDLLLIQSIDPFGPILVTWEHERVDNSIIVQDADFEISVRWCN